jgi:hypothetical protein
MATKKIMKLLDPETGLMECRICERRHFALIRPASHGKFYRGSWQCQNGCKIDQEVKENDSIRR